MPVWMLHNLCPDVWDQTKTFQEEEVADDVHSLAEYFKTHAQEELERIHINLVS